MYLESSVCDRDDLIQAGMIGMVDGLKKFNKEKATALQTKKSTYVIGCIKNAMLEEANRFYGPLRLPHRKKLRLNTFKKLLNNGDSKEEICDKMNMADKEYDELNKLVAQARRHTVQIPFDLEDINAESPEHISHDVFNGKNLTDEEKQILDMRIFQNMTYSEIGKSFNTKRETMRKKVLGILLKIKDELRNNNE